MQDYTWMDLDEVLKYLPEMKKEKVSEVARSSRGFLTIYRKYKEPSKMPYYWVRRRFGFIARHLVQYRKNPTYRRKLALIAWAYNPS